MPKVSVIVPVYNVEEYLRKCIDSILAQSFEDFELILIDDQSPDSSGEVCDEYAKKDNRIRVIHKVKNRGVSAARNDGLDVAKGDYITFVDSDDWIEPDYLEHMYHIAVENDADVVTCTLVYDEGAEKFSKTASMYEGTAKPEKVSIKDDGFCWGKWFSFCGVSCKLYLREFILDNGIWFDDSLTNGEDSLFYADVMLRSKKCVASQKTLYHYFVRADSASHVGTPTQYASAVKAWYTIMKKMDKQWNSYHDSGRMLLLRLFCYIAARGNSEDMSCYEARNLQKLFRFLREYRHTQGRGIKFEILYLLLEWDIPLYWKIFEKKRKLCKK